MGLRLKPSKTRIVHTLDAHEGQVGFDFLGFHIRQYRVGQYHTRTFRGAPGFKSLLKPSRDAVKSAKSPYRNGNKHDSSYDNLLLLHGHCHDEVHR